MANIGNLGDAVSSFIARRVKVAIPSPTIKRAETVHADNVPANEAVKIENQHKEAHKPQDSSFGSRRAIEKKPDLLDLMSYEDFAEMLRKVNLTIDLFEIQAKYIIDQSTGDMQVQIINQRTGEVIRKIPPYEVPSLAEALKKGEAVLTDLLV